MAARKKLEPEQVCECIEPHVTAWTDENGTATEAIFKRGDRLPADHPVVGLADKFWLPAGHTLVDEHAHRQRHGLHGRG
jgi:hypothetical protein